MKGKIKQAIFMCLMVVVLISTAQMAFAETGGDWGYETYKEYSETGSTIVASLIKDRSDYQGGDFHDHGDQKQSWVFPWLGEIKVWCRMDCS